MFKDSNDTVAREPYLSTLAFTASRAGHAGVVRLLGKLRADFSAAAADGRVERFDTRATESFESLNYQNSVKFLSGLMKF